MTTAEFLATLLLALVAIYAVAGMIVAAWLHTGVLARRDEAMRGASWLFRVAITPGLVALWPLMLAPPRDGHLRAELQSPAAARTLRRRHALAIPALAVVGPLVMGWALMGRGDDHVVSVDAPAAVFDLAALDVVARPRAELVKGFDIHATVLSDADARHFAVELEVADDIPLRAPVFYWVTEFSIRRPMRGSEFLGPVPGRGVYRFAMPAELVDAQGSLAILSFDDNRQLVPAMRRAAGGG